MSSCQCCLLVNTQLIEGSATVIDNLISLSVDSTTDYIWEPASDSFCTPTDGFNYFFGPPKGTIRLQSYPFTVPQNYTMNLTCPTDVSVQFPWRYIYDCSICEDCYYPDGGLGRRRGGWRGIPMKKKTITVAGDITGLPIFEVGGCAIPAIKFNIQAGPSPIMPPDTTNQYTSLRYTGNPLPFDTDHPMLYTFSLNLANTSCPTLGFENLRAFMTGFQFSFQPPKPPTVSYTFDAMLRVCAEEQC